MGCGTSSMIKEKSKRTSKRSKFSEYNDGNYYSLHDTKDGSVIDLTIKPANRSKSPSSGDESQSQAQIASSSTTDTDISSRNSNPVFEEYDELPPQRPGVNFLDDYDVPPSRSINKDLGCETEDYDIPRSNHFSEDSHDEYDYPRSLQYHADVS